MSSIDHPRFITIEGVDGAGKSTHVARIVENLRSLGHDVVHTREPGGTELGEELRRLGLHNPMAPETEVMLMFTARMELLRKVIRPALAEGKVVVCDRFTDSTWAYQGGGMRAPTELIAAQEQAVHGDLQPGLTLLFDLPVEESLRRLSKTDKTPDKFEGQAKDFHQRVRQAYRRRAESFPRFKLVDAALTPDKVAEQVDAIVARHVASIARAPSAPSRSHAPKA